MDAANRWPLFVLAADHRVTLKNMYGLPDQLGAADRARLEDVKQLTLDALIEAGPRLPTGSPGILIDEEYGAAAAMRAKELGIALAMPVEKSLQPVFELEYGDDFKAHIDRFDPDYVKALVSYNPAGDPAINGLQRERLAALDAVLRTDGRSFMLEVLVPPTDDQLAGVAGDQERFDAEVRPALVSQAISELRDADIQPTLWKLEGIAGRVGAEHIMATVRGNGGSAPGSLVLGRGEDETRVVEWLQVAAPVDGFVGFAIGRTIWSRPVADFLNNRLSRRATIAAIRNTYLRLVNIYLASQPADAKGIATTRST